MLLIVVGTLPVESDGIGSVTEALFNSSLLVFIVTFQVIPVGLFFELLAPTNWPDLAMSLPPVGFTVIGISIGSPVVSIIIVLSPVEVFPTSLEL